MTTRITGLATGLDIDSLVKTTMQAYQTKIDQQTQKKDVLEIQQKLYRDLVTKSQDFFNKYLDRSSKDCLRNSASYTSVKFESSSSAVSVKGLAGAEAANYKVQVSQLATAAKYTISGTELSNATAIRINGDSGVTVSTLKEGSTTEKKDSTTLVADINKALKEKGISNVKAKYSEFAKGIVIEGTETGRNSEFKLGIVNSSGSNILAPTNEVTHGTNATFATGSISAEQLKNSNYAVVNGINVDLQDINSSDDYLDDEGHLDKTKYLNAVKTQIDKKFIEADDDIKAKAVNTAVDGENGKLIFNSVSAGNTTFDLSLSDHEVTDELDTDVTHVDVTPGVDAKPARQNINVSDLAGASNLIVNGMPVDISGLSDATGIVNKINATLSQEGYQEISGGVQAEVGVDGNISIFAPDKGTSSTLAVRGQNSDGTIVFPSSSSGEDRTIQGTNAIAILTDASGNAYTACSEKNTVVVDNTQFTFNDTTYNETTDSYDVVKVTGTNDASDLKDKLVKFIDDYNTLITDLNTAIQTKHNRNYSPLTADQKKSMSESEIKLWEEKVEEGQLYRDSDLTRITDSLKSTMRTVMNQSGLSLEKIGIKPVSDYSGTKNGTFSIVDEDALKEAIEKSPEDVMNLFIGGSVTNITAGDGNTGVLNQLYYTINNEMFGSSSSLSKKVGFEGTSTFTNNTITNDISDYEKKIKDMQTQYSTKEQALYSKYSTLETAMNKYNSQLSYLTSAFSS